MIFFDCEVLKHDWLVVFCDMEYQTETVIVNDPEQLTDFYEKNSDRVWAGFNARHYDQYIIKGILCGLNPYTISKAIIEEGKAGWQITNLFRQVPLLIYDCMINRSKGLKELEGHMGHSIVESSVPFTLPRKATEEELQELIKYCRYDVHETIEVFMNQPEEYSAHISLVKSFKMPISNMNKTKAQLSAMILDAKKITRNDEFDITLPDTLVLNKYGHIADWYMDKSNHDYEKYQKVEVSGVEHIFGWGGVHGAVPKYSGEGVYIMSDVASLYPAIMIEYGFLSRNVKLPEKYKEIRDDRLRLKAIKHPDQLPKKIVLNSTYGASKDKHNPLFDPLQANNVCLCGQLLLLDLIEKLEGIGELIQSNTDGILFKIPSMEYFDEYVAICDEWCKRTRLELEHDVYVKVIQKDVNNYIIVDEKGKYKSKGAYVKKLSNMDYDLPIVNKAIVNYLIHNIPVEDTVNQESRLKEFQKIVKVSSKYKYGMHGKDILPERVLRVFASRKPSDGGVFKVKEGTKKDCNGTVLDRVEKIANTPEKCFIFNEDVNGVEVSRHLHKLWYVDLAKERIKAFTGRTV